MALTSCPECTKDVSSSAPSFPNCGVRVASLSESKAAGASLTTVQETSKKLKLHILMAVVAIVIGVVWLVATPEGNEASGLAMLFVAGGLLWYLVTSFRIWWHHK